MRLSFADAGLHPLLVRCSYLVLVGLASCAKADPPEEFVADPALQNDFTNNLPPSGSSLGFDYAIIQGIAIFEGDILLGRVNGQGKLAERLRARGVGKSDAFNRWPDGIVVYEAPEDNSQIQQDNIESAMEHWMEHTTISFVERTAENADQYPHYIKFLDTQSCASHVGMIGGQQPVYLSDNCSIGSVIHELGHAIGLFHEHTRPDRDNFVQIDWDAIVSSKDINFNLQTANVATYSEYDYGSIMHYGEDFFSNNGDPTIIVADGIEIGQRKALSPLDKESVNKMYQTDLALGTPVTQDTEDGVEFDMTAYNYGELGAHNIELLMRLGEDSVWKGVSLDSGWECLTFGPELKCTIDTFPEQTESRFSVLVDSGSASADDLSALLISRTQDSDPSNNVINDEGVEWQSIGVNLNPDLDESEGAPTDTPNAPVTQQLTDNNSPFLSAANQSKNSERSITDVADDTAAGSTQLSLLALLVAMTGWRRRMKS